MTSPTPRPRRRAGTPRPPAPPPADDIYTSYFDFYDSELRWCYQRHLDSMDAVWCPDWRRHAEAVARVTALWHAWEDANRDGGEAMAKWWAMYADPIMRELLHPRGTFNGCTVRDGHRTVDEGGNPPLPPSP